MTPPYQFSAELTFHFREHTGDRRRWFMFDESHHRRVPMQMEGIEGLNTVGMWVAQARTYKAGERAMVNCVVIAPDLFSDVVEPGVKFQLWDAGFFADGVVLERFEDGWSSASLSH
jgi:hypothetical protein